MRGINSINLNKQQSGFTIVELIITIIVGAMLMSSISLVVINQSNIAERAKDQTLANSFIETTVERLRSEGYNSLVSSVTPIDISADVPADLNAPRSADYTVSDTAQDGLKQIELSVSYQSQGVTQNLTYRTYIGELGVGQY